MKQKLLPLLISGILALGIVLVGNDVQARESVSASAYDKKITARFDAKRAMRHIHHLSVEIGPRVTGSVEEKEASQYVKRQLESYGYDVTTQEFSIPASMEGSLTLPSDGDKEVPMRIAMGSSATSETGIRGAVVDGGLGHPGDFPQDTAGKVALIQRGELTFYEKVANAEAAGAIGVIIYDNVEALVPVTPSLGGETSEIPVVAVTKKDGEAFLSQLDSLRVHLAIHVVENQTSQNVIAVKKPKGKKAVNADIVYVTAHYDSVPFSPGANDNASGTAVMLELARIMKAYPTDKEVRFVAMGAEEIGLVGSRYYVSQLSDGEVERSIANFNMDMVGTNWDRATQLYVNVADGQPNTVWQFAEAAAQRLGNETLVLHEGGSSDHVAFYEVGIDSANFIRREPGTANLEPWYHTPFDNIDNISQDRLQEAGELVGSAVYDLSRKQTPRGKKKPLSAEDKGKLQLNEDQRETVTQ